MVLYLIIKCANQKEEVVTRKSEKQQVIAFIDYENCSNLTEVFFNQLIDDFVAHSVNIHRTAGNKVFQRLFTLRTANQATGTAGNRFTFHTLNVRTTYRTMRREYNLTGIFRPCSIVHCKNGRPCQCWNNR